MGSATTLNAFATELSGCQDVVDQTGTNDYGGVTTNSTPSCTLSASTTNANDIVFILANTNSNPTLSSGPSNSFTGGSTANYFQQGGSGITSYSLGLWAYKIVTSTSAYSSTWTLSANVSWSSVMASFKST